MAVICKKCGGVIPDIVFNGDRSNCKCHRKPEVDVKSWGSEFPKGKQGVTK